MLETNKIGIFDSGVGGLSVLKELSRQLPHEDMIYLADSARLPYGGRRPEEIIQFNNEIIPFLIECGVKLIIMACGTSSAIAYPVVKDKYALDIVSLIGPGSRAAISASKNGKIGLIATLGTVNSGAYQKAITSSHPKSEVFGIACPLFVPLIEAGFTDTEEAKKAAREYLTPILKEGVDTIILGCTHYPHLIKILKEIAGPKITFVDPAESAVAEAKRLLIKSNTINMHNPQPKYEYVVTGAVTQFIEIGSRLLGKPIPAAKQVTLL